MMFLEVKMRKAEFLEKVEDFLERTKMSPTAFGTKAKAEPNFVFEIRKGRECREEVQERVLRFMSEVEKGNGDE